ncbi:hypothetical protein ACWGJ2_13600 [Streptomyces sp. NPDC054796]
MLVSVADTGGEPEPAALSAGHRHDKGARVAGAEHGRFPSAPSPSHQDVGEGQRWPRYRRVGAQVQIAEGRVLVPLTGLPGHLRVDVHLDVPCRSAPPAPTGGAHRGGRR